MMKRLAILSSVLIFLLFCRAVTGAGTPDAEGFYDQAELLELPPHLIKKEIVKKTLVKNQSDSWLSIIGFGDETLEANQQVLKEEIKADFVNVKKSDEQSKPQSDEEKVIKTSKRSVQGVSAIDRPSNFPVNKIKERVNTDKLVVNDSAFILGSSISAVVQRAVKTHPSVKASLAKKLSSAYEVDSQVAGYFPSVDLESGIGIEDSDIVNRAGETLLRSEAKISLRQLVFDGWETSSRVSGAEANLRAVTAVLGAQQQETSLQAAASYIDVFRSKKFVTLAKKNLNNHKELGQRIKKRAQIGYGNRANLTQVNARVALANARLIRFQGELDTATAQYQESVNEVPLEGMALPVVSNALVQEDVNSLIAIAILNNPALKASLHRIEEKVALTEQVESEFMPKIHVNLSSSWNEDVDGTRGKNNGAMGMVNLKYNLFDGTGSLARLDKAHYELDNATELMNAYRRQVIKEVRSAYIQLQVAHARLPALENHVKMASKVLKASYKQFKLGQRSILDLLDQRNELFQAEIALLTERTRKIYAAYRLLASQGRLLSYLTENA